MTRELGEMEELGERVGRLGEGVEKGLDGQAGVLESGKRVGWSEGWEAGAASSMTSSVRVAVEESWEGGEEREGGWVGVSMRLVVMEPGGIV